MNTPEHYDMEIQPIEYIMRNGLGFCEGNVVKYVSRYGLKGGIEDLRKAKHYIEILIAEWEKENKSDGFPPKVKFDEITSSKGIFDEPIIPFNIPEEKKEYFTNWLIEQRKQFDANPNR